MFKHHTHTSIDEDGGYCSYYDHFIETVCSLIAEYIMAVSVVPMHSEITRFMCPINMDFWSNMQCFMLFNATETGSVSF